MKDKQEKPVSKRKHQNKPSASIYPAKKYFTVLEYANIQGVSKATAYRTLEYLADLCVLVRKQETNKFGHTRNMYIRLSDWIQTYNNFPTYRHKETAKNLGLYKDLPVEQDKLL